MRKRRRLLGEILIANGVLKEELLNAALEIQKKEGGRSNFIIKSGILVFILILLILFIPNIGNRSNITIQDAKIVADVDKNMLPIKVTNSFPKNTSKVCAWINWKNAKINTQILVKWYYITDDEPIYDYSLNIPKREGIANVALSLPEGKTLPSGLYKVTILSGKRELTRPLKFEIQ
ncbi:MAG: hypothetical protein HY209_03130 [Candidatus Omnitrophica bacterium]|nr:hypothetical protein [Candidatus Omnitrophota bacterium]